jgi:hypothetical protein
MSRIDFRVGDWVEVRCKEEILQTLDHRGQLDGLPFMPEMFAFCGKRFQVYKSAHKTCDTVFPTRSRRLKDTVHLETRCDGSGHGGCEADCLLFWKCAWLAKISGRDHDGSRSAASRITVDRDGSDKVVWDGTLQPGSQEGIEGTAYSCQATELPRYTTDLAWWDARQYVDDYVSGNVGLAALVKGGIYASYYWLCQAGVGLGRPLRWVWNQLYPLWRGSRFPRTAGTIPVGAPTPQRTLDLCPGEIVSVKSHVEILKTINVENRNRGMLWDAEMVPFCGGTYKVRRRVRRLIDEKSGRLVVLKNEALILEGVSCQARYSTHRMFCPRSLYPFWREIWLDRASDISEQ